MRPLKRVQRQTYLASRLAGDLDAASRGPAVLLKRLIRRRLTRSISRSLSR